MRSMNDGDGFLWCPSTPRMAESTVCTICCMQSNQMKLYTTHTIPIMETQPNQYGIQVLDEFYDSQISNPVCRESLMSDSCMHLLTDINRRHCIERPVRQRYISCHEKVGGSNHKPYIIDKGHILYCWLTLAYFPYTRHLPVCNRCIIQQSNCYYIGMTKFPLRASLMSIFRVILHFGGH